MLEAARSQGNTFVCREFGSVRLARARNCRNRERCSDSTRVHAKTYITCERERRRVPPYSESIDSVPFLYETVLHFVLQLMFVQVIRIFIKLLQ